MNEPRCCSTNCSREWRGTVSDSGFVPDGWGQRFCRNAVDRPRQAHHYRNAVAALPLPLVAAELADGTLAALPWRPSWLVTAYGFVYRRDRTLSPAALAFMEEVRRTEAALVAD
jgi:DNA-binding transcriptional LysR family regulator